MSFRNKVRRHSLSVIAVLFVLLFLYLSYEKILVRRSEDPKSQIQIQTSEDPMSLIQIRTSEKPKSQIPVEMHSDLIRDGGTVHIVLIVVDKENPSKAGISVCERVETLLKSILVFYNGKLHLHLLTSRKSGKILSTLFRTWHVANVRTSFYNVEADQGDLAWVKSYHEASGYGQLKYIIPDVLPVYVEKAIFLDSDMLVLEDISILHSHFIEMEQKGIMFSATTDQYYRIDLEKTIGKGASKKSINSGLVLYNLKAMRQGGWSNLWRKTGVMLMNKFGKVACPQDLLAALAFSMPETFTTLSCLYNFQIGAGSMAWDCIKNKTDLWKAKIPHWTGQKKYYEMNGHTAIFTPIYRCFQKISGYDYEKNDTQSSNYRTLTNIRNIKWTAVATNITLAAHVRFGDSIELIKRLNGTWLDPISLVVCGGSWERALLLSFLTSAHIHDSFDIHYVYKRGEDCPMNYLRRIAVDSSRTNMILISDSITTVRVDEELRKILSKDKKYKFKLHSRKTLELVGVSLDKELAQRISAEDKTIKEGIASLNSSISFIEMNVDSMAPSDGSTNQTKWTIEMPSDDFCREEIDRRRNT